NDHDLRVQKTQRALWFGQRLHRRGAGDRSAFRKNLNSLRNRVLVAQSTRKYDLTTKENMKATKDSDIYTLNFVLFVTFVLKVFSLVAAYPAEGSASQESTRKHSMWRIERTRFPCALIIVYTLQPILTSLVPVIPSS